MIKIEKNKIRKKPKNTSDIDIRNMVIQVKAKNVKRDRTQIGLDFLQGRKKSQSGLKKKRSAKKDIPEDDGSVIFKSKEGGIFETQKIQSSNSLQDNLDSRDDVRARENNSFKIEEEKLIPPEFIEDNL